MHFKSLYFKSMRKRSQRLKLLSGVLTLPAIALGLAAFQDVAAQNTGIGPYSYARIAIEHFDFNDNDIEFTNIGARVGYMFMPMVGFEGRFSTTVDGYDVVPGIELKNDYSATALLRLQANIDPGVAPYVAIGASTNKLSIEDDFGFSISETETDVAGFVGVDLQLKSGLTVGAEVGQVFEDATTISTFIGFDF